MNAPIVRREPHDEYADLERWIVGGVLAGFGSVAINIRPADCRAHANLVLAWRWLIEHGGVRHAYEIRGRTVVLTIDRLREALAAIGSPAPEREVTIAELLMTDCPHVTPKEFSRFEELARRWHVRVAAADYELAIAEGREPVAEVEQLRDLLVAS